MTLVELYNKNCVSYYGIEYSAERLFVGDDKESEAVRCKEFMHEHYMAGKKHELLDSALYTQYESKGKHVHSVSLYLLGKALLPHFQQEIDKKLTAFLPHYSGWHDHNRDFLHTWFLTSMYHDFASCIEFGTIQANDSERHRSLAFHLGNHDIRYSIYGDYPYKTQNVPIRFSKELIENYFYYRACSGACEHGIIAGNLFFDRFVKTFLKATKENRFDEAGNWDGRDGNWNTDMIMYSAYIADAIICHNIWLGGPREEETYMSHGLTPLLWHIHPENKLSIRKYPLQFMLCLLDTIEPTKRFCKTHPDDLLKTHPDDLLKMHPYDILNKISIEEKCKDSKGFDIVWNESLETDDGNNGNSFKQWYTGIKNMPEWMDVTCEVKNHSIEIRWN